MGMTRSSVLYVVSGVLEEVEYLLTFTEIATGIKTYVLVLDLSRRVILGEPHVEELNWWRLTGKAFTMQHTRVMIRDEAIARFSMKAS